MVLNDSEFCVRSFGSLGVVLWSSLFCESVLSARNCLPNLSLRRWPIFLLDDGAENELQRAYANILNDKALIRFATQNNFNWHFNQPHASHMGGAWERMIRTVRRVLIGVCFDQRLSYESFETLLTEIEATINGRPLTKLSDDPHDPAPLTPNHMLIGSSGSSLAPGKFGDVDALRRRWKLVQRLRVPKAIGFYASAHQPPRRDLQSSNWSSVCHLALLCSSVRYCFDQLVQNLSAST